jgi:crotonobetainyl-CoA:carnitine CoA-transferase CaiB-like acyl-CoA transferase
MLDAVVSLLSDVALKAHVDGTEFVPFGSGHPDIVPYQAFKARDGYFIVACLTGAFWKRLPAAIGRPELLDDERFRSMKGRVEHRAELERILNEVFAAADVDHWIERIEAADIPTCRVNSLAELFALPQLRENETLVKVPHPTRGEIEVLGCPVKMSASATAVTRGAPTLGEHTDEVLESLGIGADERSALRARGVLGGA